VALPPIQRIAPLYAGWGGHHGAEADMAEAKKNRVEAGWVITAE